MYVQKKSLFQKECIIYTYVFDKVLVKDMESFRYGLSVPYIQTRASEVTLRVLKVSFTPRTVLCVRRYNVTRKKKLPKKFVPPVLKVSPVFSIELDNMFDILEQKHI